MSDGRQDLEKYLERHSSFGGWSEKWDGVPLVFRTCIANTPPPRDAVGSVRTLILKEDEVLLVKSSVPILNVGGRALPGESIEQTAIREAAEETGWRVSLLGIIGFVHCRHLDEQRPNWGRPAPDFIDPLFASEAESFDPTLLEADNHAFEFIPIEQVEAFGIEEINRRFLAEALALRAAKGEKS